MQLAPMAKDITYFITAKPYLSSRTQQILDLFILFNLKSQNFLSPVSLMSLISLVNNFSQGGTAVKIPNVMLYLKRQKIMIHKTRKK